MKNSIREKIKDYLNKDINIGCEYKHDLLIPTNPAYRFELINQKLNVEQRFRSNLIKDGQENNDNLALGELNLKSTVRVDILEALKAVPAFLAEWRNELNQLGLETPDGYDQLIDESKDCIQQINKNGHQFHDHLITEFVDSKEPFGGCLTITRSGEEIRIEFEFIERFNHYLHTIYNRLEENEVLESTQAAIYKQGAEAIKDEDNVDELKKFIVNFNEIKQFKTMEEKVDATLEMTKGQSIKKAMFFEDGSICVEPSDDQLQAPDVREGVIGFNEKVVKPIVNDYIDYFCRKKPKYKGFFQDVAEQTTLSGHCFDELVETMTTLMNNEALIKSANPQLLDDIKFRRYEQLEENYLNESTCTFKDTFISKEDNEETYRKLMEKIVDEVDVIKHDHDIKKYAKSILSKKYEFLLDDTNLGWFKELYDNKVSQQKLEETVGVKLASYTTPEMLTGALKRLYSSVNEFSLDNVMDRTQNLNVDVISKDEAPNNEHLILKINDYEASNTLGSPSWCISTRESYFKSYTRGENEQYFIYDFTKSAKDNDSMLGITLDSKGNVDSMHYKDDRMVLDEITSDYWRDIINEKTQIKPRQTIKNR